MGTASQPTGKHNGSKGACLDDEYMMLTYKVIPCSRLSTHNWKLCQFSHAGEDKARRRHPSCHQADLCSFVSVNKECPEGDRCPYAHNAFESWLHPDRFKTTMCSYGAACTRKFCFFAHSVADLRRPAGKQLSAAAAAAAAGVTCTPQLRLTKPTLLDTNSSIGTPNSSSSSSTHATQAGWGAGSSQAASPGNGAAAAAAAAGAMYLQQLQPMGVTAAGIPVGGSLAGGMYLPMCQAAGQHQQQHQQQRQQQHQQQHQHQHQQLMTAYVHGGSSSSLLTHAPVRLPVRLMLAQQQQQLAAASKTAAAATPTQIDRGFAGGVGGMQLTWNSLASAQLASLGAPMATGSSTFSSTGLLFDPTLPSMPPAAVSVPQGHSLGAALPSLPGNAAGNVQGSLNRGSLRHHALNSSCQQQHNGQPRQQLLQHLLSLQQQKQPVQQAAAPVDVGSSWSLAPVDVNGALVLNLDRQLMQPNTLGAVQDWSCGPRFELPALSGMDVQVMPSPQGFKPLL